MRNFRMQDLDGWEPVELDTPVEASGGPDRRILLFRVMASAPVSVFASDDLGSALVAYGDGLMRVRVAVSGVATFTVTSDNADAEVFVSRRTAPQVVGDKQAVSFATIQPKAAGMSLEVKRMQMWMRLNERRRDAVLSAERAKLQEQIAEVGRAKAPEAPSAVAPGAVAKGPASADDKPPAD